MLMLNRSECWYWCCCYEIESTNQNAFENIFLIWALIIRSCKHCMALFIVLFIFMLMFMAWILLLRMLQMLQLFNAECWMLIWRIQRQLHTLLTVPNSCALKGYWSWIKFWCEHSYWNFLAAGDSVMLIVCHQLIPLFLSFANAPQ